MLLRTEGQRKTTDIFYRCLSTRSSQGHNISYITFGCAPLLLGNIRLIGTKVESVNNRNSISISHL